MEEAQTLRSIQEDGGGAERKREGERERKEEREHEECMFLHCYAWICPWGKLGDVFQ